MIPVADVLSYQALHRGVAAHEVGQELIKFLLAFCQARDHISDRQQKGWPAVDLQISECTCGCVACVQPRMLASQVGRLLPWTPPARSRPESIFLTDVRD